MSIPFPSSLHFCSLFRWVINHSRTFHSLSLSHTLSISLSEFFFIIILFLSFFQFSVSQIHDCIWRRTACAAADDSRSPVTGNRFYVQLESRYGKPQQHHPGDGERCGHSHRHRRIQSSTDRRAGEFLSPHLSLCECSFCLYMYVRLIFRFFFFSFFDFRNWRPCCVPRKQRAKDGGKWGSRVLCLLFRVLCLMFLCFLYFIFYFLFYFHGEGLV